MASRRGIFREGLKLCGRRPSPPALFHERTDRYSSPAALRSREGGVIALLVILTVGLVGGLLYRVLGMNTGVQFMGYYAAVLSVPAILKLLG